MSKREDVFHLGKRQSAGDASSMQKRGADAARESLRRFSQSVEHLPSRGSSFGSQHDRAGSSVNRDSVMRPTGESSLRRFSVTAASPPSSPKDASKHSLGDSDSRI